MQQLKFSVTVKVMNNYVFSEKKARWIKSTGSITLS